VALRQFGGTAGAHQRQKAYCFATPPNLKRCSNLPIQHLSSILCYFADPMKGIIFNLLEEVVIRDHGADTWDELLSATCLDGAYTSLGSYPDEHIP
jgi:hypothetical protein